MSRALVTGGSGLIGRRVVSAMLAAGHDVHVVTRHRPATAHPDVQWHCADLLAETDVVKEVRPDVLVHLAWQVEHRTYWTSPDNALWNRASQQLIGDFARAGGRRVVVAGTCAEYDWTVGAEGPMDEESTPLRPATPYGQAKHELHVAAAKLASETGVELVWGRVFSLYAPDEGPERLFASLSRALLSGQPARTTAGRQVRDYLHADDVGSAFAWLVSSPVVGAVNIGSGEGISIRDLAAMIADAAGRPDLLQVGAIGEAQDDTSTVVADVRRLRDEAGFSPRFSLAEGIRHSVGHLAAALTAAGDAPPPARG